MQQLPRIGWPERADKKRGLHRYIKNRPKKRVTHSGFFYKQDNIDVAALSHVGCLSHIAWPTTADTACTGRVCEPQDKSYSRGNHLNSSSSSSNLLLNFGIPRQRSLCCKVPSSKWQLLRPPHNNKLTHFTHDYLHHQTTYRRRG